MSARLRLTIIIFIVAVSQNEAPAQNETSHEQALKTTESQLRSIYERNEFRARRFRARWLPDSSGYIVRERRGRVRYDVPSGERTVLSEPPRERSGDVSPDGKRLAVLTYVALWIFERPGDDDRWLQGKSEAIPLDRALVKQNEAIGWETNRTLLMTNEQRDIFRITLE